MIPRPIELAAALVLLIVLSPLLAAIAVAMALTSPGPVLFRHQRMGRHGRPFAVFKFRTMQHGAVGPAVTMRGDSRITPLGRVLRGTKLDELPTLWNVVRGEMALVGPRPEALEYVALDDPAWRDVLSVRPGSTDPVTLRLRNEEALLAAVDDRDLFYRRYLLPYKLQGYRLYLAGRTCSGDLRVLRQTLVAVLSPARAPAPSPTDITSHVAREATEP
jgi:lipopolysaccharide/colanic/teichoic acid biosynthesis glycosyltransferase